MNTSEIRFLLHRKITLKNYYLRMTKQKTNTGWIVWLSGMLKKNILINMR